MINFIKEQLKLWRFKKSLHKYTLPERVFLKSARIRFVALAQQHADVGVMMKHSHSWRYATIAVVAVLSMTSGIAVFADANNVSVTHPLYNLKRLSENVRLELSSPEQKLQLHQVLVQRRLKEVTDLNTEEKRALIKSMPPVVKINIASVSSEVNLTPRQIKIKKLDSDFRKEAESVLDQAQRLPIEKVDHVQICKEIINTITRDPASPSGHFLERIQSRCGEVSKRGRD